MRIGIDARLWGESGVGRYIRNLVRELGNLDTKNEYCLFVLSKDLKNVQFLISNFKNSSTSLERKQWKVVPVNIRWHSFAEQIKFPQILNREKLDLMHFPYVSVPVFYNKPFIMTIHDLIPYHFPTGKASRLPQPLYEIKSHVYRLVLHIASQRAKKIIVPSISTRDDVVKTLKVSPERLAVTSEGIDSELIEKENSGDRVKNIINYAKYFLYVGNAYPHKNVERMINAFVKLTSEKKDMDLKLVLVGKDDYFYEKVHNSVEGVKNILFLYNVTDSELSFLYKHAHCLIAPSLLEGFGLPALEALSHNCLVLASDIPVFHEVCGEAALYVDPYDENALRGKMLEVYNLSSEKKKELLASGTKRLPQFSWKKMASETCELYESSIGVRQGKQMGRGRTSASGSA